MKSRWGKYAFEFLLIFIAVLAAFMLNNWNDNRKDANAEAKLLFEMSNGLEKDLVDLNDNFGGHKSGIAAVKFWRKVFLNQEFNKDSLIQCYFDINRDYISLQNTSAYTNLKSRGLELIGNDSLRLKVIALYEYDYVLLKAFEEEYVETQFHESYFNDFNEAVAPNLDFNKKGNIIGMKQPFKISSAEKNILLSHLWKNQLNRGVLVRFYEDVIGKVEDLRAMIAEELD